MSSAASDDFYKRLIAILPRLHAQAFSLTRNSAAAEDLVQDAICNAIAARESFIDDTNLSAWMHRIVRNRFLSDLRKRRDITSIDDIPESMLATSASYESRLVLKEIDQALGRLLPNQREALWLVVFDGLNYEQLAEVTNCAIGTAKSRVFRARRQLELWLAGDNTSVHKARQKSKCVGVPDPRRIRKAKPELIPTCLKVDPRPVV